MINPGPSRPGHATKLHFVRLLSGKSNLLKETPGALS